MKRSSLIWVTIICIILGFTLTAQLRTQAEITYEMPTKRLEEMVSLLKQAESERDTLREQVHTLNAKLNDMINKESNMADIREELQQVQMAAGLTELEGPGIAITLNDSNQAAQQGQEPSLFLIHDEDLLKLVNELKAAEAEAITINGHRIVTSTEIRCAGPTISVNNTRIAPPYVIHAIGDPETLEAALKMRGGVMEILQYWNIQVQVEKKDTLTLPAYIGSRSFRFARPAEAGKEEN